MPLESVHEQIAECLLAKLQGIVAGSGDDDPHYSTGGAARVSYFHVDWLNKAYDVIYLLRAEDEMPSEAVSGSVTRNAEFYILGAKQFQEPGIGPWNVDRPLLQTVQNRLVRDVELSIWNDVQLRSCLNPSSVENLRITDVDRTIVIPGWAVVQIRLECTYDTLYGRP